MERQQQEYTIIGDMLRFIAPGTPIRSGIENVLRAKTGGLIVVGYNADMESIVDGGFAIHSPFSSASLYELAKMDGAIILNGDGSSILFANVQLIPDPSIPSKETGMRHRTAERVAKQTGNLVIAISERRNVITLYKGNIRYALKDIGVILTKANQALQTLEKYKLVLDQGITNLGALEFEDSVTLTDVIQVIHRIKMVLRIKSEILSYVNELGTEGRLIQLQLTELVSNIEDEAMLLIKDYCVPEDMDYHKVLKKVKEVAQIEVMDDSKVVKLLGYGLNANMEEIIYPRGYRILHKIPRLPTLIIDYLVKDFGTLDEIAKAPSERLVKVNGIGEVRAEKIKNGLNRIQEQLFIDRHI
ncbi:DNA integrity scanning diadenylate cyclase DisA [Aquibacillus koreensis]|uniref:DNA integrity scanning protein DisA n=1 Tax=Aquibacillus koreensis TaxID=279446 RepID=A0A9X4ALF6_9BACI|nr:DNA integrity scanning diadenylate cyclase DisA [Aquibacillus koreensis]MCT2536629.1 DNA integrity scanning diadenylate cyclase DisA [Aquibacillus koreensis]MDC3422423.1 DNA integrity scanning diadenylate cyclase DisA [Aquibacillus koreensis]